MSLHVGMFINYFSLVKGGAEMYVADLSACLEGLGCRVTIVAGRSLLRGVSPAREGARVLYAPCLFELREAARRFPPRFEWLLSSATESFYTFFARGYMERFDIVHCHGYDTARAALNAPRRRGPVVLTMHGPPSGKARVGRLLRGLDGLVSPSESIRDQVRHDHGVEAHLIPMGVDLERFVPLDRALARRRLGWDDAPTVLFAGRLIQEKDLPTLLRAFSIVVSRRPDARLKIAGDGVQREALAREAASLKIADRVEFLGGVARTDLPLHYAAADIQALPSSYENFPMVALEGLACGVSLVISDAVPAITSRFAEVASFPAGDHEALAARLLAGLDGRLRPIDRARLESHAWPLVAEAYMDLYRSLSARKAA